MFVLLADTFPGGSLGLAQSTVGGSATVSFLSDYYF